MAVATQYVLIETPAPLGVWLTGEVRFLTHFIGEPVWGHHPAIRLGLARGYTFYFQPDQSGWGFASFKIRF